MGLDLRYQDLILQLLKTNKLYVSFHNLTFFKSVEVDSSKYRAIVSVCGALAQENDLFLWFDKLVYS